jgi:hypothetical protein
LEEKGYVKKVIIDYPKTITFIDEKGNEKKVKFSVEWLPVIDAMIFAGQLRLKDIEINERILGKLKNVV